MHAALDFDGMASGSMAMPGLSFPWPCHSRPEMPACWRRFAPHRTVGMQAESLFRPFKAKQGVCPGLQPDASANARHCRDNRRAKIAELQSGRAAIEASRLRGIAMGQTMVGINRDVLHSTGDQALRPSRRRSRLRPGCHRARPPFHRPPGPQPDWHQGPGPACDLENFLHRNTVGMPGPELRMAQGNPGVGLCIS